jgi:hypothetical protein
MADIYNELTLLEVVFYDLGVDLFEFLFTIFPRGDIDSRTKYSCDITVFISGELSIPGNDPVLAACCNYYSFKVCGRFFFLRDNTIKFIFNHLSLVRGSKNVKPVFAKQLILRISQPMTTGLVN